MSDDNNEEEFEPMYPPSSLWPPMIFDDEEKEVSTATEEPVTPKPIPENWIDLIQDIEETLDVIEEYKEHLEKYVNENYRFTVESIGDFHMMSEGEPEIIIGMEPKEENNANEAQ